MFIGFVLFSILIFFLFRGWGEEVEREMSQRENIRMVILKLHV